MLKIGVLGAGHLGTIHLKCIQLVEELELVGCYDIDEEKCKSIASKYGIKPFESAEALIEAVDIVDIVTPTVSHFELAEKAIKSGRRRRRAPSKSNKKSPTAPQGAVEKQ